MRFKISYIFTLLMLLLTVGCASETLKSMIADTNPLRPKIAAIQITNYCPRTGWTYKDFWAVTMSYKIVGGGISVDFDRDGIPDALDNVPQLGIHRLSPDTNNDGYSDLLMLRNGSTVEDQNLLKVCETAGQLPRR